MLIEYETVRVLVLTTACEPPEKIPALSKVPVVASHTLVADAANSMNAPSTVPFPVKVKTIAVIEVAPAEGAPKVTVALVVPGIVYAGALVLSASFQPACEAIVSDAEIAE